MLYVYGTSISNAGGPITAYLFAVLHMPRRRQAVTCLRVTASVTHVRRSNLFSPRSPVRPSYHSARRAQDSLVLCLRPPFQVHRHPGSNLFSIAHCKTTPNRRGSTSLSATSSINSISAIPPMKSFGYYESRRRSFRNIETEIAS